MKSFYKYNKYRLVIDIMLLSCENSFYLLLVLVVISRFFRRYLWVLLFDNRLISLIIVVSFR